MLEAIQIGKDYIIIKSLLVGILWACVIIAVTIDLYHGIRKSKKDGEFTHSLGLRRTVDKSVSYLSFMAFMLIGDIVLSLATSSLMPVGLAVLPLFNLGGALVLVYNEWVSVKEKSDQKMLNKINKSSSELSRILVETLMVYKNNPGVLEEILKRYSDSKSIENNEEG